MSGSTLKATLTDGSGATIQVPLTLATAGSHTKTLT